jgi:transcriptional regulator with XRE-family HTH domain
MPAAAPPNGPKIKKLLRQLGRDIRSRRKELKLSAVTTSEAAGISRMTLNRIESGEASVTMGAYLNVISVLGIRLELRDPNLHSESFELPDKIRLAEYPQLKRLAWQLKGAAELTAKEAVNLYERNWRYVEQNKLTARERQLIKGLMAKLGRKRLLV